MDKDERAKMVGMIAFMVALFGGAAWEIADLDGHAGPVGFLAASVFYLALAVVCIDGSAALLRAAARRLP